MKYVLTIFIFIFIITIFVIGYFLLKFWAKQIKLTGLKIKQWEKKPKKTFYILISIIGSCFLLALLFMGIYLAIYI